MTKPTPSPQGRVRVGTFFDDCIRKCLCKPKFVLNLHPRKLNLVQFQRLAHGVIGNTPVFGTVIQGSSPCGPTESPDAKVSGFFMPINHSGSSFSISISFI